MKSHMMGFYAVLLLWLLVLSSMQAQDDFNVSNCYTTTDTRVHQKNLVRYTLQRKPLFRIDAVRFLTIKGKVICSNPSSPWAIKSMKYLDAKNKPRSVSNKTAHHSVTVVPKKMSTTNTTSAQSGELTENRHKRTHNTQKNPENKTQFPISSTKTPEQDWRGSSEATETFQLDGPTGEKGVETEYLLTEITSSTIMNEPFIKNGYFCLKGEKFKYLGS